MCGRLLIGFADSMTIIQQTIMCCWFPTSRLPYVFGIMLFLVKIIRAINDNVASVINNEIGLVAFFWIGFTLCIFSLMCSYVLAQIHESVIDNTLTENKTNQ